MAGILRLSNTGTGNGQSTITTAASGDVTYTLPSGGGTFVTTASTQALTVPFASGTVSAPSITFLGDSNTGLYSPAADTIAFTEGGVEALRIDSSGRVGIGTTSPSEKLVVVENSASNVISRIQNTVGFSDNAILAGGTVYGPYATPAVTASLLIGTSNATPATFWTNGSERARIDSSGRLLVGTSSAPTVGASANARAVIQGNSADSASSFVLSLQRGEAPSTITSGEYIGQIMFAASDGSPFAEIAAVADANAGTNDYPGRLMFSTTADGASSPTERMRISANGNVSIGLGTDLTRLYVRAAGNTSSSFNAYITNTDNNYVFVVRDDGLFYTGAAPSSPYNYTTVTAANVVVDSSGILYRSTSSARYKTNIETLEDTYADNILNCRPVWYRSTANADDPSWGWWGFIAEEVAEIDPRLVFWKTKETKLRDDYVQEEGKAPGPTDYVEVELETPIAEGVQYDRFVPHLLNLIKRQQQAIETLEAKVAALESA